MSNIGNKEILSKNLKKYIDLSGKDRKEIAKNLNTCLLYTSDAADE